MATIEITLSSRKYPGFVATIDEEDFDVVSEIKWHPLHLKTNTYASGWDKNSKKMVSLHRLLMDFPPFDVDHKDGNGLNNSRSNLRIATRSQNITNGRRPHDSTSGVKGVSWHKSSGKWRAYIVINGRQKQLGTFDQIDAAAACYAKAAIEFHGEFARLE